MKSRNAFAIIATAFGIVAGTVLYAQFDSCNYAPGGPVSIVQVFPQTASTNAAYGVGPFPMYRPVLAPGDGREEVNAYCNTCHSPIYITMQPPLPADTWTAEMTKMQKTYGAEIPDDAYQKITRYLQSHYTPETRKH
jgi:hypothetical protein